MGELKITGITVGTFRLGIVTVTGPLAEVEAWKVEYFAAYYSVGYGTFERSRVTNPDGTVTLTVWRANSCD